MYFADIHYPRNRIRETIMENVMKFEDKSRILGPGASFYTELSNSHSADMSAQLSPIWAELSGNTTTQDTDPAWSGYLLSTSVNNNTLTNRSSDNTSNIDMARHPQEVMTDGCLLYWFIVYTIVIGLLCFLGMLGNITAFFVFWKDNIKTSSSFLFQGLSFIDTILLIIVFPIYCLEPIMLYTGALKGFVIIQPYLLVYLFPAAMTAQTITIWVTVLVGVNRYIAVCRPYSASRLCTVNQARKQLAVTILMGILYNVPRFFEAKLITVTDPRNNQTHIEPAYNPLGMNQHYLIIYNNAMYLVFMLTLPLVILTILNVRLINALNELRRKRKQMNMKQQADNNVTFVLIIVVLVFTICQAPALVNQILWNVLPNSARACGGFQFYFQRISNALVVFNSSVNFLIYFLFNTRFKQVLMQCVCKKDYKTIRATNSATCKDVEGTNESLL